MGNVRDPRPHAVNDRIRAGDFAERPRGNSR
jgi:hypothetical protein